MIWVRPRCWPCALSVDTLATALLTWSPATMEADLTVLTSPDEVGVASTAGLLVGLLQQTSIWLSKAI